MLTVEAKLTYKNLLMLKQLLSSTWKKFQVLTWQTQGLYLQNLKVCNKALILLTATSFLCADSNKS